MNEEAWERFVGHAERVLARPRFDEGFRDWKFDLATELRRLLEVRADVEQWLSGFDVLLRSRQGFQDHRVDLPAPRHVNWLRRWARADPISMRRALDAYGDPDRDPVDRFEHFVKAAVVAPSTASARHPAILAMGSLFNFALAPDSLPIMRAALFNRLAGIVGADLPPQQSADAELPQADAIVAYYAHHLDFAREVGSRLENAGLAIRDMVDVQSLIFVAATEHEFWAYPDPEPTEAERARARIPADELPYLAVCATYRNEAPYLQEWIEFHELVGVERFFLYDNGSTDNHQEVLAPYVADGTVVLQDWPLSPGQVEAYNRCLVEHRYDARWIAFLDLDEFLFSPSGTSVSEVLEDYERFPGVGVNWIMFGTSGHRVSPPGLVIENHLLRAAEPWTYIKNIVDPARALRCMTVHVFDYAVRDAVDENKEPITFDRGRTQFTSTSRLRINHYYLKSEIEGRAKLSTPKPDGGGPRPFDFDALDLQLSEQRDDAITSYLPALRAAIDAARQERGKLGSSSAP